jgi:tyrosinase
MSTVVDPSSKATLRTLRLRSSVSGLDDAALAALRQAFSAMYGISDDRGYAHHAGIHGLPLPMYCQHGNLLFLPWHRAYLYFFEQAMMDQVGGASLAWWDWTQPGVGVPPAFDGGNASNALARGPITGIPPDQLQRLRVRIPQGQIGGAQTLVTWRRPKDPSGLPSQADVQDVLNAPNFLDFSRRLEDIHNNVHVWVGGAMGMIPIAAYDPIFWAHHTMIDRLWWLWQLAHPAADVGATLIDVALAPFPMTVRQTLDINALGYEYAVAASTAQPQG